MLFFSSSNVPFAHPVNLANEFFWALADGYETTELFAVRKLEHHVLLY
jgi:hypothetical protein